MIEIDGVGKAFGATTVLDGVDLTVPTGGSVALLGPSGVGKSTLLRIIAGLDSADRGAVRLDGIDLGPIPTHQRGIGFMFQDLTLFPHLDVRANVDFGLRMQRVGSAERRQRADDLLDLVGLPGAGRRDPGSLSGGEQQRVALARALAPRPAALLLDEPFGALDRTLRDRLLVELKAIFDDLGLTVIAVTHDPTEAAALADRIAVMLGGSIVQAGTPAALFAAPASLAVARTLGLRNLLEGPVLDGAVVVEGWGNFATPTSGAHGAVVVPRTAVRVASARDPRAVEAEVVDVALRDGVPVCVLRPVGGGPPLEVDLEGGTRGEWHTVWIDRGRVHAM